MKTTLSEKLERDEERGLSTLEYVVLFVVIVVGALTLWSKLGGQLDNGSDTLNETLDRASKPVVEAPEP
jgi:Flp pilus assembly pilin Flp